MALTRIGDSPAGAAGGRENPDWGLADAHRKHPEEVPRGPSSHLTYPSPTRFLVGFPPTSQLPVVTEQFGKQQQWMNKRY